VVFVVVTYHFRGGEAAVVVMLRWFWMQVVVVVEMCGGGDAVVVMCGADFSGPFPAKVDVLAVGGCVGVDGVVGGGDKCVVSRG
jgi:hypothetical protein